MLNTLFALALGLSAQASDFDCVYKVSYQPLPTNEKYIKEVREINIKALKECGGKAPCDVNERTRVTYDIADVNNDYNPTRKYEEKGRSRAECKTIAEKSCQVARAGVLASKKVEATYKGETLIRKICKENGSMVDMPTAEAPTNTTSPITSPKKTTSGAVQ